MYRKQNRRSFVNEKTKKNGAGEAPKGSWFFGHKCEEGKASGASKDRVANQDASSNAMRMSGKPVLWWN